MRIDTYEITYCVDSDDVKAALDKVPAAGPSLHPNVNVPDLGYRKPYRWNGWNDVVAAGIDADGNALVVKKTLFASGWSEYTSAVNGETQRAGRLAFDNVAFPVRLLPAKFVLGHPNHPEWTPEVTW